MEDGEIHGDMETRGVFIPYFFWSPFVALVAVVDLYGANGVSISLTDPLQAPESIWTNH